MRCLRRHMYVFMCVHVHAYASAHVCTHVCPCGMDKKKGDHACSCTGLHVHTYRSLYIEKHPCDIHVTYM